LRLRSERDRPDLTHNHKRKDNNPINADPAKHLAGLVIGALGFPKMMYSKIATFFFIILTGCGNHEQPSLSVHAKAQALSNHSIQIVSYEIPKGIFRGALWPSEGKNFFEIWIIDDGKEKIFDLEAPPEFMNYKKAALSEWEFQLIEISDSSKKYLVRRNDGSKSLHLELPIKKRDYSFTVLNNSSGNEILIFMDISERIVDSGLFGYVTIEDKT
jgi:hypothetical protein